MIKKTLTFEKITSFVSNLFPRCSAAEYNTEFSYEKKNIRKILLTRFFLLLKWGRFQYRALLTYS